MTKRKNPEDCKKHGVKPSYKEAEIAAIAKAYIDDCKASDDQEKVKLPTIEGLALRIGKTREMMYHWEKSYPEFATIMQEIRDLQKEMLINNGLQGRYNPTIAKLVLSVNHGMRESSDITSNGESIAPQIVIFSKKLINPEDDEQN